MPTGDKANTEIGEQRSQADNVVQTLKGDGYNSLFSLCVGAAQLEMVS